MSDVDGLLERLKWCVENRSTDRIEALSIEGGSTNEGDDVGWTVGLPSRHRGRVVGVPPRDAAVQAIAWNCLPQIIAAIEQQRAEIERLQRSVDVLSGTMSNAIVTLTMRHRGDQLVVNFEKVLREVINPC